MDINVKSSPKLERKLKSWMRKLFNVNEELPAFDITRDYQGLYYLIGGNKGYVIAVHKPKEVPSERERYHYLSYLTGKQKILSNTGFICSEVKRDDSSKPESAGFSFLEEAMNR